MMSAPPITISPDLSCKDASKLLTRYNINAFLVIEASNGSDKVLGVISRQVIEKALSHTLDQVPVREYMTTEIDSIGLDAELTEIQEKIIQNKQRILPVIDKGRVAGVITRTDLIELLAQQSQNKPGNFPDPTKEPVQARTRNVQRFMKERLSPHLLDLLGTIGKVADDTGFSAYVVGGFVRDLFLYRPNEDIDIVIEGDGIAFAKKYAKIMDARIHSYKKFGTAVIIYPDGFKIDVASARIEYYKSPAALPTVEDDINIVTC